MALEVVESISHETVRQTLKNGMTKRKIAYWVIPPRSAAELIAHMEEVLERYEQAYDPTRPVLCMDEQPIQLIDEMRSPLNAPQDYPKRVDYD